ETTQGVRAHILSRAAAARITNEGLRFCPGAGAADPSFLATAFDYNSAENATNLEAAPRDLGPRAPEALRCRFQAAISETSCSWVAMRLSRHWLWSTPISISTMFSQLACLGT